MIYAGFLNFKSSGTTEKNIRQAIETFTQGSSSILRKNNFVLCYGKLSKNQDVDEVWENDSSILIGRVFDKKSSYPLKKESFKDFLHHRKEEFLSKIWGKYVYIKENKQSAEFEIVLDPTGQLPFFYYSLPNGNILFASDIEIIFKTLAQKPDYNWEYLCSYLIYGNSSSVITPFKGIFELPPACCLRATKNERKTTSFWDPLGSYNTPKEKEKNAVNVLQKTLKPWITPYKDIIVSLSGGLDSSSLVYCLKDIVKPKQNLKALNYFHSQIKSSNELRYARKVCEETRIELIEVDVSDALPFDLLKKKNSLNPNKPLPAMVSSKWLEKVFKHINSDNSSCFISGHGSDHIFMRPPSKNSAVDCFLEKGFRGYKEKARSITHFYRDPLFSTLKENFKGLASYCCPHLPQKRNIEDKLKNIPAWFKKELREKASTDFAHPIYQHLPLKTLPGKYAQIQYLYEGLASIQIETMNQANPTCFPFLYEPVIEFALSFPTYELFDKGFDRYPLRKAISDHFKTDTVWRRDKSQTTGLFQLGIKKNLEYVLALCLEGHFVKQGLVDKEGLNKTIHLIASGDIKHLWPFLYLTSAELFLKSWDETII